MTFRTVGLFLVFVCLTSSGALNSQLRHRERRGLSRPTVLSHWGDWGSWSACSRTCGGGVAAQTRICLMKSRGDGGVLRESTHCVGLYKQYKLCNSDPCPENNDFRQEQCESHNDVPFMGTHYQWIKIYKEPNLCELNCKAVGSHFFAKLADKVVDGTPCRNSSTTEICVDGMCKAIGCDGILGSGLKLDKCGVCGGSNNQCEVMSGVFTGDSMGHGYHTIAIIPTGAMYINVTELRKSRNYLALEGTNGNKYINMDWKIDASGNYSVAGTYFIYKKSPGRTQIGEQFFADGPTTEDLNLILISQQKNPGISYEYSVPTTSPSPKGAGEARRPPESSTPQPPPNSPQRGHVNIRQDAPASKTQVSGGVSLSTFLNAGNPAPVFPSTGAKQDPAQRPVEPQAQGPVESYVESPVAPQAQRPVEPQAQRPVAPQPQRPVEPQAQRPVAPLPQLSVEPQAQHPVAPQEDQLPQEEDTSLSFPDMHQKDQAGHHAETDPSGQQQISGVEKEREVDGQLGSGPREGDQQRHDQDSGPSHHEGKGHRRGQQDGDHQSEGEIGGHLPSGQKEVPQADSGSQTYQGSPVRGYVTQGRGLPESVYQQTLSSQDQTGSRIPGQGQSSYLPQGRDPMYPTQGDDVHPVRGTGYGRPYTPPNAKPNPYPGRYQSYSSNQDPAPNPNPRYPNANSNPYPNANPNPNSNPNPYPNRNPYPNQNPNLYPNPNPYPSGGQRIYPNPNVNANPYRNPNGNPNPYPNPNPNNPYPSYRYPTRPDTPGRQPVNPQQPQTPFLEIDPIESHRLGSEDSSTLGSSDFSALEGGSNSAKDAAPVRYGWVDAGLSDCSASCAGGIQQVNINCIEWRTFRQQDPSLCDATRKPIMRQQACNMDACPPVWQVTEWMECSRTCGTGRQMRQVSCKQTLTATLTTMVPAERCDRRLQPDRLRECIMLPCTSWRAGEWGECNVACGEGRRHREVRCVNDAQEELQESACADKQHSKPRSEEACDMGPCISNWFVSEWNDLCSAECGGGHKKRHVVCTTEGNSNVLADRECNTITKPRTSRTCNSMPCGAVWLTSEWNQCSKECGEGIQDRMVLCTGPDEPHVIVNEVQCANKPKPTDRQSCKLKDCQAMWFNSDWTQCSRTCGGGQRKREVKCLDANMDHSLHCNEEDRPSATQSCNIRQCTANIPVSGCRDKFPNCAKIAQARFCTYMYYKNNCCFSCFGHRR